MRKRIRTPTGLASFGVFFGGIWLIVGGPFLAIGIYTAVHHELQDKRLSDYGQRALGMVLSKSYSPGNFQKFSVEYRFTTGSGVTVKQNASITGGVWDRLAERGQVQVTYLPERPAAARVEGQVTDATLPLIFSALGGILTTLGAFVLILDFQSARRGR